MKRFILYLSLAAALLTLFSCADTAADSGKTEKFTVVTTIFPQYDFACAIAKDTANVEILLPADVESHTYEPTSRDIAKITKADLFIYTGGGIDPWADDVKTALEGADTEFFAISSAVEMICADSDRHHENCPLDEHVWTSPKNAVKIFDSILSEMIRLDPENAEVYKENAEDYRAELTTLDAEYEVLSDIKDPKPIVFADRFPFLYLFSDYGMKYEAALSGCSVGDEITAERIAELTKTVTDNEIKYIFVIENSKSKVADLIREATGAEILTLHSCHNISAEKRESGATYISIMKENLKALKSALDS